MTELRPSLLIADDDPLARAVLGVQLDTVFRLVGAATDSPEAVKLATDERPDAALIDVNMPGGGARTAIPAIAAGSPHTRLVILSAGEQEEAVADLLAAGASAYVEKGSSGARIANALMAALAEIPPMG